MSARPVMAWSAGVSGAAELLSWRVPGPNRTSVRLGFVQNVLSQPAPPTPASSLFLFLIPSPFLPKKQLSASQGHFSANAEGDPLYSKTSPDREAKNPYRKKILASLT